MIVARAGPRNLKSSCLFLQIRVAIRPKCLAGRSNTDDGVAPLVD